MCLHSTPIPFLVKCTCNLWIWRILVPRDDSSTLTTSALETSERKHIGLATAKYMTWDNSWVILWNDHQIFIVENSTFLQHSLNRTSDYLR